MGNNIIIEESGKGGIILYQTPDGQTCLEVKLENETVWLTRQQMAMLFGRDVKTIGKHINNALREELAGESVVAKFATPKKYGRREGFEQTQYPEYYSLENNGILYAPDGSKRIADNALVALTLMIAESKADEMDMMVKVIVNLINKSNR